MTEKDDESVGKEIAEATGDLARNLNQETPMLQKAGGLLMLVGVVLAITAYFEKTADTASTLGYAGAGAGFLGILLVIIGMTRKQI